MIFTGYVVYLFKERLLVNQQPAACIAEQVINFGRRMGCVNGHGYFTAQPYSPLQGYIMKTGGYQKQDGFTLYIKCRNVPRYFGRGCIQSGIRIFTPIVNNSNTFAE